MNAPLSQSASELADRMITRAKQARSIVSMLSFAVQNEECPPTKEAILDVLSAVETILTA